MCFEPYVRIMGFFVETMGGDGGGGDEVGGAVLGELLKEVIGGAPFGVSLRHFGTLSAKLQVAFRSLMATRVLSRIRDIYHVIASMSALNSPSANSSALEDPKYCDNNPLHIPLRVTPTFE